MSAVAVIPQPGAVDAAWERYQALAIAVADDPRLAADRAHMEAMARAEAEWKDAYLTMVRR